jgi:pimeloyl-ACP methyl ester carboxylesterase
MTRQMRDFYFDSTDGLRLYCAIYDAQMPGGLPVLCLPGLTRNSRDFAALGARLSARHEVLAPDLRGRGRSAWDPEPAHYNPPTYVQDVFTLLQRCGHGRVVVIGTSLGALMGLLMGAMRPDLIAGLVLNEAAPELNPAGLLRIAAYAGKLPPVGSWPEAAAQVKSVYGSALPGLSDAQWLEYARQSFRENPQGVPVPDVDPKISEAFKNFTGAPPDMWALFDKIKSIPMLVFRGALSDVITAAAVARMAQEKPDMGLVTVANRGHAPLLNEPECLAAIDGFLAVHGRNAPVGVIPEGSRKG